MSGGNGAETLVARVEAVVAELDDVAIVQTDDARELRTNGSLFAVVAGDALEIQLDPVIADAAQRTPDVAASPRGPGWVRFRPQGIDRFALDRADAWLRTAHRAASARRRS